ncbi:rnhA operon protein [Salinigranum rubrum]|uniref:RnhA operon protein n=1 Tax=Salinigranum rubrum TaxID=755307 RepID=A0A2I8VPM5_9EURY|nr:rnhA operon protein [Salinigranum rubrum]AUV83877.1 rnhA operon protein [Salinigranum rubrum]
MPDELPADLLDDAERLTRLARDVPNPDEAAAHRNRRDELLAEHGYTARYREDDDTLVLNPSDWFEDGVARTDRIDDLSRAVEVPLSDAGADDDWREVEAENAALVERVSEEHGAVHAANARAFADFLGNHYTRRIEAASGREVREFLTEYYPRNAWPTAEQKAVVEESLRLLFDAAGRDRPSYR